jgi:hypothetical protein
LLIGTSFIIPYLGRQISSEFWGLTDIPDGAAQSVASGIAVCYLNSNF